MSTGMLRPAASLVCVCGLCGCLRLVGLSVTNVLRLTCLSESRKEYWASVCGTVASSVSALCRVQGDWDISRVNPPSAPVVAEYVQANKMTMPLNV